MPEGQQGPTQDQMSRLLAMVLVFGLAGIALPLFFGGPDRWEYRVESPDDYKLSTALDRLGSEGWEVVAARRATSGSSYSSSAMYELILKRRIGVLAALTHRAASGRQEAMIDSIMRNPLTPPGASPSAGGIDVPTRTDYSMLDRQGSTVFAFLDKRWASDTSRIRLFGKNLCGGMKSCTVRFWTAKPGVSFSLPLPADLAKTQVAVYARPGDRVLFPNR